MKTAIISTLRYLLSHVPTKLPVGLTAFEAWADSIIAISGEYADRDSMKYALATMIMHADAKHGSLPKSYFVTRLRKVAANQVAGQVFQDIKLRKDAEILAKQAEDTAKTTEAVSSDDSPKENAN